VGLGFRTYNDSGGSKVFRPAASTNVPDKWPPWVFSQMGVRVGKRSGNGRGALVAAAVCFPCGSATSAVVIVICEQGRVGATRPAPASETVGGRRHLFKNERCDVAVPQGAGSRVSCVDLIVLEHLGQFLWICLVAWSNSRPGPFHTV
jgi:hypothetical protein